MQASPYVFPGTNNGHLLSLNEGPPRRNLLTAKPFKFAKHVTRPHDGHNQINSVQSRSPQSINNYLEITWAPIYL